MSVEIDPPELGFRRPFTSEVTQILRLSNPHNGPVAFKVKTTAPKQYCVRPNSGNIEPNRQVEIQVLLQAMKEEPSLDTKCRDKFLVQSAMVTGEEGSSVGTMIENTPKDQIKERKIRVTFLPANDTTPVASTASVNGVSAQVTPAHRSPSPANYGSPSQPKSATKDYDGKNSPDNEGSPSLAESAKASVVAAAEVPKETIQKQLETAESTITQLKAKVENQQQGLRQRKTETAGGAKESKGATTGTAGMHVQTPPANGVPVQIVAALCLLSFLLAYFFF